MNAYVTGGTIRTLREKQGCTQRQLAEKLMVSDKAVSKWEQGRGLPDITLLEPLAGALGVSVAELLSGKYQSEQAELEEKIEQLQSAIAAESQSAADAEKWIALMKECVNPTELTAELLNTLIEKILVHEAVKNEDGSREQEVEIFYRFIGKID